MDKQLLLKYINGEASSVEKEKLHQWLNQDSRNREYFAKFCDLHIFASMPNTEASNADMDIAESIMKSASQKFIPPVKTKPYPKNLFSKIAYYGIAGCILIALCVNIFIITSSKELPQQIPGRELLASFPTDYIHTIYTNRGVKGEVKLPDGSVVKLNSDSKVIFPDKFSGSTREVYVSGEAYFNVVTNPDTPMIVSTNRNFMVKVYGTEFNLRSYENEPIARTTLFKGKIDLFSKNNIAGDRVIAKLKPNEAYVVRAEKSAPLHVIKADTLKQGAWRYGNLRFDSTPMDEVVRELERWHGAEVTVKDKSIYDLKFSASFKQESLVQILEILKFCSNVNYELNDNKVTLFLKK